MEPPEALTVHAVPHPNPKVQRVGFELHDTYVELVYAGVIGPTSVMLLRRLPVLWREREPALVDLRELGLSLGLGASTAPSGCPATSSACAPRWRRCTSGSSAGCPSGPARSTIGSSARISTGSPPPNPTGPSTPIGPSTSLASPPAS